MAARQTKTLFTASHPILNVKDVIASLEYYCGKLGFKQVFVWPTACVCLSNQIQPLPRLAGVRLR